MKVVAKTNSNLLEHIRDTYAEAVSASSELKAKMSNLYKNVLNENHVNKSDLPRRKFGVQNMYDKLEASGLVDMSQVDTSWEKDD